MEPEWPDVETFARRPREALMWLPRALDVARIAAACRAARADGTPRVVDVGAGTGLLARLLSDVGVAVEASDPTPPARRYHSVSVSDAAMMPACDVALVSWMEAGRDYREAVAKRAKVIVNVYDVEGGCGVMGAVDFAPYGFVEAVTWRTPSFEDAEFRLDRRARPTRRPGHPGNRIDLLSRPEHMAALRAAVHAARAGPPLPWEREMDEVGL